MPTGLVSQSFIGDSKSSTPLSNCPQDSDSGNITTALVRNPAFKGVHSVRSTAKDVVTAPACVHLISGALAGGVSRTVTAPLDRLKAVLQVTRSSKRVAATATLKRLAREEGLLALFKGNGANCIKVVPECAIKFVAYDFFKRQLIGFRHSSEVSVEPRNFKREIETEHAVHLSMWEKFIAGGTAGVLGQLVVYPMEVVKTRLATAKPGLYRGIGDCISQTYSREGLAAFYRGLSPSLLGIVPYAGLDLACFETLKREYCQRFDVPNGEPPVYVVLGCGGTSSAIGQIVAYPLALVRTRLQVDGVAGQPRQFRGMWDVFCQTVRHEGYLALYRGIVPNLLKAVPAVSITWAVYESSKQHLHAWADDP